MKDILNKILARRGLKLEDLDKEEKKTFDQWDKVLSKDELTLEDIKEFCKAQCSIIENKWKSYDIDQSKKAEMISYHVVYKTLLAVIESPKVEREGLERNLNQLLNT